MACNCKCVQQVIPTSVTAAAGVVTITLPATFVPVSGCVYDISLEAAIPEGTNGAVITITNGTITGNLLNRLGSNVRMGPLNAQWILRTMFLADPNHYNLLSRRLRNVN